MKRAPTLEPPTDVDRWESLLALLESIGAHRTLSELLDEVARRLHPLVGCDTVLLICQDAARGVVQLKLLGGKPTGLAPESECAETDSSSAMVIRTQQPVFVDDTRTDEVHACSRLLAEQGLLSSWMFPLTTSRRKIGAIAFCGGRAGTPAPEEQRLLARISNLIALAVENALAQESSRSLEGQLRAERDRLQLLLDVNAAVVSHLDLDALIAAIGACLGRLEPFANTRLWIRFEDEEDEPDPGKGDVSVPLVSHERTLGSLELATQGRKLPAADLVLLEQVASQVAPAVENACSYCEIRSLKDKLAREKVYLETELKHEFGEIVGESGSLRQVLQSVETVAPTDSTVLVWGETGTGKELIARAIHEHSGRKKGTFVKLNCAAIPTGLLESELFGHEKGAFTGALAQRIGRFELADGGTLFLDEVGDIPPELQPKLLRVLQERELERLGGNATIKVDVRLVAATNRDLARMVAERQFRSDLYYRLNVFPITLPALRERTGDVPLLVRHFVQRFAARMKKRIVAIPEAAMEALAGHDWPGNIRELENFIERAVILTRGSELEVPIAELRARPSLAAPAAAQASTAVTLADAEREHILRALEETRWVVGGAKGAAARLGMSRTTLQAKMERLGIKRPS